VVFTGYILGFHLGAFFVLPVQGTIKKGIQMSQLANLLTTLSLFCGFSSVLLSLAGEFTFSAYAIILSVVLDGFDGQVARKTQASSEFGKELDSLVDVVSFGVAPVLLGSIFIYRQFYLLAIAALFIYLLCAVIRLARYNIVTKDCQDNCFNGLPTTVSGGVLVSFVLVCRHKEIAAQSVNLSFIILVLILASLMVSRIRYLNLDGLKRALGGILKPVIMIILFVFILALYFNKVGILLFSIFLIYLIFSPFVVKRLNNV